MSFLLELSGSFDVKSISSDAALDFDRLPFTEIDADNIDQLRLSNTYYPDFEDFKTSVLGFFEALGHLDPTSLLGCEFRSRIRDKFRAIGAPNTT